MLKPNWIKFPEMKELNPSLSIAAWYVTVDYAPFCFLPSNYQKKEVFFIYCCSVTIAITGTCFMEGFGILL